MPRDAYLSTYAMGGLSGFCDAQDIVSRIGLGRPFDGKLVFYSSLFQAGIDRVVGVDQEIEQIQKDPIPPKRHHVVACSDAAPLRKCLQAYFDYYLQPEWFRQREHLPTLSLASFLGDLLISLRLGRPLLTSLPLPDLAPLQVTLPLEILSPVQTLFQSIRTYESVVAIPTHEISKDRLEVVDEIMASGPYVTVEEIHNELVEKPSAAKSCLAHLEKASQALYWRWKDVLRLKSSVIRIVQQLPDIVEMISGKATAGATKPIVELLAQVLREGHGLLLYDAVPLLEESLVALARQLIKSPQPDAQELERRVAELKHEKIT